MAITRIQESFDEGAPIGALLLSSFSSASISTSNPRTGTRHQILTAVGSGVAQRLYSGFGNLVEGIAYGAHTIQAGVDGGIVYLCDNGTAHLELRVGADRVARVYLGPFGTVPLAIGSFAWPASPVYTQWALQWKIDDATGLVKLWINGNPTPDIDVSGIDTRNGVNAYVNDIRIGARSPSAAYTYTVHLDDVLVQDLTGAAPENAYLGDVSIVDVYPDGAGDDSDGVLAGSVPAATRHEALDEVPVNDGVDTVQFATAGLRLLMHYAALTDTSGTIFSVSPVARWRKLTGATRSWKAEAKLAGVSVQGPDMFPSTSWVTEVLAVFHRDPSAAAWTGANVNAAQFGGEVTL